MQLRICSLKYVVSLSLVLISAQSFADTATDEDLSKDAVLATLQVSDEGLIAELSSEALDFVEVESSRSELQGSTVVASIAFKSGKSPEEIQEFVDAYGLEVSRAEIKHPIDKEGKALTISVGAFTLSMLEGTLSERLRMASGAQQFSIMQQSKESLVDDSGFLEVANTPALNFYRLELVGAIEDVGRMAVDRDVAAIVLDTDPAKADSFIAQKEQMAQMKLNSGPPIIRKFEEGLPPGVLPEQILNRQGVTNWGSPLPGFRGEKQ